MSNRGGGVYEGGTEITVSVTPTTGIFVAWEGDVPGKDVFSTNLTLTVDKAISLRARTASGTLYAAPAGKGAADGSSWNDALALQDALDAARQQPYSLVCAMAGLYPVEAAFAVTNTAGPIRISGGYSGVGFDKGEETLLARTDSSIMTRIMIGSDATFVCDGVVVSNGFVYSGTGGPWWGWKDSDFTTGYGLGVYLNNSCIAQFENCAFRRNGSQPTTDQAYYGAAIGIDSGVLTVRNCLFKENSIFGGNNNANGGGGAIATRDASLYVSDSLFLTNYLQSVHGRPFDGGAIRLKRSPVAVIANCRFEGNYARRDSGGGNYVTGDQRDWRAAGGAISALQSQDVTIRDSYFDANWVNVSATDYPHYPMGGTMLFYQSNVKILRTVVRNGGWSGYAASTSCGKYCTGAIDLWGGTLELANVLVADTWGGWMLGNYNGELSAVNCTFTGAKGNGWDRRKAVVYDAYQDAAGYVGVSTARFENCIFWNCRDGDCDTPEGQEPEIVNSITMDSLGDGNSTADPLFGDDIFCHPKSAAGRYDGGYFAGGSYVVDDVTSPAVDMGREFGKLDTEPQPNGCRLNVGYDGGTPVASKSVLGSSPVDAFKLGMVAYEYVLPGSPKATFYGDVTGLAQNGGDSASVTFVYGSADAGVSSVDAWENKIECANAVPWELVAASAEIAAGQKIYYRFVAKDSTGATAWSDPVRSYTGAASPVVIYYPNMQSSVTRVFRTTARVNVKLVSDGNTDTRVAATVRRKDGEGEAIVVNAQGGAAVETGSVVAIDLAGLVPGTEYLVNVTATNPIGSASTEEVAFRTATDGVPLVLRVDTEEKGRGDGSDWQNATTLDLALLAAQVPGDEILIKAGRYVTSEASKGNQITGRALTIRGGYGEDGAPHAGETILSGSDQLSSNHRIFRFSGCTVTLDSLTFTNGRNVESLNEERYGNAIGAFDNTDLTVTNCVFANNGNFSNSAADTYFRGGAIGVKGGTLTVFDSVFATNSIHGGAYNIYPLGGAIGATDQATVVVRGCRFDYNHAQMVHARAYGGGAIGVRDCAKLVVDNCLFTTNYAHSGNADYDPQTWAGPYGGTLYIYNTPAELKDIKVFGSWCRNGESKQHGWDFGGTFYLVDSVVTGERIEIRGAAENQYPDTSGVGGYASGAITVAGSTAQVSFTNILDVAVARGAFITQSGGALEIVNGTFAGALGRGYKVGAGTVYSQYTNTTGAATASFRNCIFYGNAGGFRGLTNENFSVDVSYCDVEGAADPERHIIDADPAFTNAEAGDYTLKSSSPCINAGDRTGIAKDSLDLNGQRRIMGGAIDLGCYERQSQGFRLIVR